jgi:hypothetical protein
MFTNRQADFTGNCQAGRPGKSQLLRDAKAFDIMKKYANVKKFWYRGN